MKKLIFAFILTVFFVAQASAAGSATGGSTKPQVPPPATQIPAPEPTVTPTQSDADKKAAEEAARKARLEMQQQEPKPITTTPAPAASPKAVNVTAKATENKLCNDIEDMKKRIECRMKKSEAEIEDELAKVYMPEECRAITDNDIWKNTCVDRYKKLRPCWSKGFGEERISCVKERLGLPQKLQTIDDYCKDKPDSCQDDYKKKIYNLVTFRFYDAEERVEEWYEEKKISLNDAVDFITFIAQSKIKFYQEAKTKGDRLAIIDAVSRQWDSIVAKVKK